MPKQSKMVMVSSWLVAAACTPSPTEGVIDPSALKPGESCAVEVAVGKSLVVNRADAANESAVVLEPFTFKAVMDRIADSAGLPDAGLGLYKQWMSVAGKSTDAGLVGPYHCDLGPIDPNKWGYDCNRAAEGAMANEDPFDGRFTPIALFNRFDLMPESRNDCGEYRVVFGKTAGAQRFFIIFEAKLANPGGAGSVEGCNAVGEFWRNLSSPGLSAVQRRDLLRQFYFEGVTLEVAGLGEQQTDPVLTWSNFASGMGQLRTNQFAAGPWTLREFRLELAGDMLRARPDTVKTNMADDPLNKAEEPMRAAALAAVKANYTGSRLLAGSLAAIAAEIPGELNSWESANDGTTRYADSADAAALAELAPPADAGLTTTHVLNRLSTQTCIGCHQESAGADLGGGLVWPGTLGFVHVDEAGRLSPALTGTFLPARAEFMQKVICGSGKGEELTFRPPGSSN